MTEVDELRLRLARKSDGELLDLLRSHDTDEWRPEVFDLAKGILRGREIEPPEPEPRHDEPSHEVAPGEELVVIASFPTVVGADACRVTLAAAGFTVVALDERVLQLDPTLGPALGWFRLAVPREQAEDVRAYLDTPVDDPD